MALQFDDTIKKIDFVFRYAGINIKCGERKKKETIKARCMYVFNFFWLNVDVSGSIFWFIDGVRMGKDFIGLTYIAPCISLSTLANIKSVFLISSEKHIYKLIDNLRELEMRENARPRSVQKEEIINTEIKFLNYVLKTINILYVVLVMTFALSPLIIIAIKYMQTGEVELILPFLILYPFDPYNIKLWPFVYLHQFWSECVVTLNICCSYIRIQFRLLQHDFERIISAPSGNRRVRENDFKAKFIELVKWHQDAIESVSLLETIYSKSILFNFMSSSLIICLTGFNITVVNDFAFVVTFLSFLFMGLVQVFFLCFFADLLSESSVEVSNAVYNSQWYMADSNIGKQLLLVQTRAQKPCKLTAWGFADVNLNSFMRVLSTAWSYFALLQTVYGQ
ncbi:putative odorant receptor 92a [Manduca sexta]|uniref:Odorant receptor n=1 Tax=Manduca sexta TaxID=7130 RepID=A0A0P1IW02_MANSE|nr:putative odorant receptor 92a [Manduca sexta]CUQ99394.1 Olfactory receptor 10 [Manduca sexta]